MPKNPLRIVLLTLLLAGIVGGPPQPAHAGQEDEPSKVILVTVDDKPVYVDEFIRFLAQDATRVPLATTTEGKATLLKEMVARELLIAEMVEAGDAPPNATPKEARLALDEYLAAKLDVPETFPQEELRDYFEANRHEFGIPGSVRLSQIQIRVPSDATDAEREAARARADKAYRRLSAGEAFADVAKDMTENPERKGTDGDLGFVWREGNAWLESALAGISPGEFTEVLASPVGYDIILLVEEREPVYPEFEDAKEEVERRLRQDYYVSARDAYVKQLADKADIEIVANDIKEAYPNGLF